jgi:hypothetical protein
MRRRKSYVGPRRLIRNWQGNRATDCSNEGEFAIQISKDARAEVGEAQKLLSCFAEGDEFGAYGDAARYFDANHGFERLELAALRDGKAQE